MPMSDLPDSADRLHVVILAAGASNRFGSPKQIADFRGESLVRRATTAAKLLAGTRVTVVLGAHSRLVEDALLGEESQIILNADWRDGLASSVRKGLLTVPPAAMAVLLMPVDMPLIDGAFLRSITASWAEDRSRILTCTSERGAGLPAIVPRRYFKALMSIKGDPGINSFFARHREVCIAVELPEKNLDIDTRHDMDLLQESRAR